MPRIVAEASRKNQLVACAWWNTRQAQACVDRSRESNVSDSLKATLLRDAVRLDRQAQNLFDQAGVVP